MDEGLVVDELVGLARLDAPVEHQHLPYEWVSMISMNWNLVCGSTMVRAMACMWPSTGVVVSKNHLYWSGASADQPGVVTTATGLAC